MEIIRSTGILRASISAEGRSTIGTRKLEVIVEADEIREIRLDRTRRLVTQPAKGHNRWHPAIQPVVKIDPGDEVVLDTLDALDCQISSSHGVADAAEWDLNAAHPLTGPVWINGTEIGDLLEVQLLDIIASDAGWAAQLPGFGFLRDLFP